MQFLSFTATNHSRAMPLDLFTATAWRIVRQGLIAATLLGLVVCANSAKGVDPNRTTDPTRPIAPAGELDAPFDPSASASEGASQPRFNLPAALPGLAGDGGIAGGLGLGDSSGEHVFFSAKLTAEEGTNRGTISLTADIEQGFHIYSITQPPKGPQKSVIELVPHPQVKLSGRFTPDQEPKLHDTGIFPVLAEEHTGKITWSAPVEFSEGVNPEELTLEISFQGQVCDDIKGSCQNIEPTKVAAKFSGTTQPADSSGVYLPKFGKLKLEGTIEPAVANPGSVITITIKATPIDGYHVYAYAPVDRPDVIANKPTLIDISRRLGWKMGEVKASSEPIFKKGDDVVGDSYYHEEPITWTTTVAVPMDATFGDFDLVGYIGYQTCLDTSCLQPTGAQFKATVTVSQDSPSGVQKLAFSDYSYAKVAELAKESSELKLAASPSGRDLPINWGTLTPILGLAFLGGLILNLMPCVLPVLGLKILSFAKQGGQSRSKVILLNVAYTAGLLSVFLVLAALVAFANMGWGEQFTQLWFRVTVTAIVFVMSLSFLGVWELPIPGFATSEKASELQSQEGVQGAFYKGIFTTVIATPCSGPFLGTVLGLTLDQPIPAIFMIFTMAGLGMASPYLLVGLFPQLSRVIPKPGAWMETFERLLGFLMLLAAVVQFSTIGAEHYTAALMLMVGLAFACWMIGRVPETATTNQKISSWFTGTAVAATIGFLAFAFLTAPHASEELPWQPYSKASLAQLQSEGKTVLVDFTADWCLTCQYNSRTAINTPKVQELVKKNGVVTLLADWTNPSPEIKDQLTALRKASIPLLVVYPAGKPQDAIVLPDLIFENQVIEALEKAGPSQGESAAAQAVVGSTNHAAR